MVKEGKLLEQLGLCDGQTSTPLGQVAMEAIMERCLIQTPVHDCFNHLPNRPQQANLTIVPIVLWQKDHNKSTKLAWSFARIPNCLHQLHKEAPVVPCLLIALNGPWVLLLLYTPKSPCNISGAHERGACRPVSIG